MIFSSSVFLLAFLPISLGLYYINQSRAYRNIVLLVTSLVFYSWGEPTYVVLMIASVFANWLFALCIEKAKGCAKVFLVFDVAINLLLLGFFKYEGFLAETINELIGATLVPDLDLPLPIGISFYTLQALTYVVDVYRKEVPAQKNPLYLGMYIAMFPQLVAGPIVRYKTIQEQILNRKENLKDFCSGARLFIIGLSKKVLLANVVAILATKMLGLGGDGVGLVGSWAGLLAYTFQIFFDFSGYSDMAIGLGKMFGFKYLRNFNYPYISKSITEFWRRWHISLSSFFRDYIYIPLGGNRVKKSRWIINLTVVWLLTGLWHGAAWNFVLWGLFYLAILLLEKFVWGARLKKLPSVVQHLYTMLVFMFAWLLFWIEDMTEMGRYLFAMIGGYGLTGSSTFWELTCWEYVPVFALCAIASVPVVPWIRSKVVAWVSGAKAQSVFKNDLADPKTLSTDSLCANDVYLEIINASSRQGQDASLAKRKACFGICMLLVDIALIALLLLSLFSIVSGSFNPFIYFRF